MTEWFPFDPGSGQYHKVCLAHDVHNRATTAAQMFSEQGAVSCCNSMHAIWPCSTAMTQLLFLPLCSGDGAHVPYQMPGHCQCHWPGRSAGLQLHWLALGLWSDVHRSFCCRRCCQGEAYTISPGSTKQSTPSKTQSHHHTAWKLCSPFHHCCTLSGRTPSHSTEHSQ